jgi:hypothetical protein
VGIVTSYCEGQCSDHGDPSQLAEHSAGPQELLWFRFQSRLPRETGCFGQVAQPLCALVVSHGNEQRLPLLGTVLSEALEVFISRKMMGMWQMSASLTEATGQGAELTACQTLLALVVWPPITGHIQLLSSFPKH